MVPKHSNKLLLVLVVAWFTPSAAAKPGFQLTPDDCERSYENGYMYHCEYVKCVCESNEVGGEFYHTDGGSACQNSSFYSCSIAGKGEFVCILEGWCRWYPDEVLNPDREPDWAVGPSIVDAGQVVTPVEGGSGIPGAVGGGPGTTELVETDTGDGTGAFNPGEVFQADESSSWFAPGAYGHGAEFQLDAFLADAPLDYLEALLELQTLDVVRPDIPVSHYLALRQAEDCNDNGILDAVDIAEGTSLDLNEDGVPDECEQDEFGGTNDLSLSEDANDHAEENNVVDDGTVTKLENLSHTDSNSGGKTDTAQAPKSPCGSGVGAPVVMLSLCWMFVAAGRTARQRTRVDHDRSNSNPN